MNLVHTKMFNLFKGRNSVHMNHYVISSGQGQP